jgi:hypothetical protein
LDTSDVPNAALATTWVDKRIIKRGIERGIERGLEARRKNDLVARSCTESAEPRPVMITCPVKN